MSTSNFIKLNDDLLFNANGNILTSAHQNGVEFFDIRTKERFVTIAQEGVRALAYNADSSVLAVIDEDDLVSLWDISSYPFYENEHQGVGTGSEACTINKLSMKQGYICSCRMLYKKQFECVRSKALRSIPFYGLQ